MSFERIAGLAGGHAEARAIQVALKLGLFEVLAQGEQNAAEVATRLAIEPRATMLLANALVALGLFSKRDQRYGLAEAALEESIRSGKPARAPDMFQDTPEAMRRFIRGMDSLVRARGDARWTAEHLDLSFARTIVDLGGGPGTYLVEFLRRWPQARGAIYDLPETLKVAGQILSTQEPQIRSRIELCEADYNAYPQRK
jgi:hypothetical protein